MCIAIHLIHNNEEHVYIYIYVYLVNLFNLFVIYIYAYMQKYCTLRICELQSNPLKLGHTDQSSQLAGPHYNTTWEDDADTPRIDG